MTLNKLVLLLTVFITAAAVSGADFTAANGAAAWSDRKYIISGLPENFAVKT